MARRKIKWSVCFCYLLTISNLINSVPLNRNLNKIATSDVDMAGETTNDFPSTVPILEYEVTSAKVKTVNDAEENSTAIDVKNSEGAPLLRNSISPEFKITQYDVELTINGGSFDGRVVFQVRNDGDLDENLVIHSAGLNIREVRTGSSAQNLPIASFSVEDDELEIEPVNFHQTYTVVIEYSGTIGEGGSGLYTGDNNNYLAMNLNPTNARRVFPCIDELTETPIISLTVNGVPYQNLISISLPTENDETNFRNLQAPPRQWALVGHGYTPYNSPVPNVILSGRPGLQGQESQASVAINSFFNTISEWTEKSYFDIVVNQASQMHIIVFPDVATEWHSLAIVGIWEPYVFMEQPQHAVKQRQVALIKIAEAIARPWFGYALIPSNWIYQWVLTGLTTYIAYEAAKEFQSGGDGLLDYDTLFVTEVLQESLYRDGYSTAPILEPDDFIFDETALRLHLRSLMNFKAPALMYMLRDTISTETDFIQVATRDLLKTTALDTVSSRNFFDMIIGQWPGNSIIGDFEEFITPYIKQRGCPLLTVNFQSGQVFISRSSFNLAGISNIQNFFIPITYTTSTTPNFDDVLPSMLFDQPVNVNIPVTLGEEDWIIFNLQGRGYYRVQYSSELWERIIEALADAGRRTAIHPLNRATLLDDSLNLARRLVAGLEYDIAFRIVLTMEHETEYAPWKAYLRNFNFIKKRLEAMVAEDEDLDPDIYLRMVRRTIGSFEDVIGFSPETNINEPAMTTLTRGMVMDYACRAGYDPCIAAAVDWFYSGNDEVNPNIPHDLKPAVYCSLVKQGDAGVREMLFNLLADEIRTRNMYDRLVILEALACSQDSNFIDSYLSETVASNSPYSVEERFRIFAAVADSSYSNAGRALNFMMRFIPDIRQRYGGSAKVEEMLFILADNMANNDLVSEFESWLANSNNNLGESEDAAAVALQTVHENLDWNDRYLQEVYDWIDENDATTTALSMFLLSLMIFVHLLS